MQQGFPDWIAAVSGFSGAVLFMASAPRDRFDGEKITAALISLCLVSIIAATKPIYGLLVITLLIAICSDAVKYLTPNNRNRLIIGAITLVAIFVCAYVLNYSHLAARSMPHYPVSTMSERFRARPGFLTTSRFRSKPWRSPAW